MLHQPVLLQACLNALALSPLPPDRPGLYIDGTFGRGGHSAAILAQLGPAQRLMVLDKDPQAIAHAQTLYGSDPRVLIQQGSFADLPTILGSNQAQYELCGILLDLGCSSPQLDTAERGFSFQQEGPLDMRMNPTRGLSAAEWLEEASLEDIIWVLRHYGEEKAARPIAQKIIQKRMIKPLKTTLELVDIIQSVLGKKRYGHKHPATRSFQAIRIHINQELSDLEKFLEEVPPLLSPGGRLAIISFHSLEDRLVKEAFKKRSLPWESTLPKGLALPPEHCPKKSLSFKSLKKQAPLEKEKEHNPRSRSAILRVLVKDLV